MCMPAPEKATNGSMLLDSHEDRLQKVEEICQVTAIKISEIGLKQDYAEERQEQFRQDLAGRMDSLSSDLRATLELNRAQEARLEPLEAHVKETVKAKKAKKDLVKKLLIGALLAGAGVVGTKGVEMLFAAVVR